MRTGADLTQFEENIGAAWDRGVHRLKEENNLTRQSDIAAALDLSSQQMAHLKSGLQRTTATQIFLAVKRMGLVEPLEELARECGYTLTPIADRAASMARINKSYLASMHEAHQAIQAFAVAAADGNIDESERATLVTEFQEAATACNQMVVALGGVAK